MDWDDQKNSWVSFGHNAKRKKKRTQSLLRASLQLCHGEPKATMWSRHARLVWRDWGKLVVMCVDFFQGSLSYRLCCTQGQTNRFVPNSFPWLVVKRRVLGWYCGCLWPRSCQCSWYVFKFSPTVSCNLVSTMSDMQPQTVFYPHKGSVTMGLMHFEHVMQNFLGVALS